MKNNKFGILLSIVLVFVLTIGIVQTGSVQASVVMDESSIELSDGDKTGIDQLTDTGQSACFNADGETIDCPAEGEAFFGQDAQYSYADFSYTDNEDGTVTDNVTGLVWEQTPSAGKVSWDDAQSYCEVLDLGGSDDWRTPSLKELFSLSDFSMGWPYIDTDYFNLITESGQDKQEQYWSSNFYEVGTTHGDAPSAIGVNHATGHIKAYPDGSVGSPMSGKYVRCVQGDDYLINDYADNGDGTVTDATTGLMWMQMDTGEGVDWEEALALADESTYAGYDDWRLPNVKELQSIVDYSGVYPAIDPDYFEVTDEDAYFWTSTSAYFSPADPGYYYAWYVAFGYAVDAEGNDTHGAGAVRFDTKEEGGPAGEDPERVYNYVRLVRGGDVTETLDGTNTDGVVSREFTDVAISADARSDTSEVGAHGEGGGQPGQEGPDLVAAAATLGIDVETLMNALGEGQPNFAEAASLLGIDEETLVNAIGMPPQQQGSAPQGK